MAYEQLKLENQLCFPVYATSRLITREYQPYLDKLGITYPQYLVLMILWEKDEMPVNDIAKKLILNTNTVTPLLKRMEQLGLVERKRSSRDERKVLVCLSSKGREIENEASKIPEQLAARLLNGPFGVVELRKLKDQLGEIINLLTK